MDTAHFQKVSQDLRLADEWIDFYGDYVAMEVDELRRVFDGAGEAFSGGSVPEGDTRVHSKPLLDALAKIFGWSYLGKAFADDMMRSLNNMFPGEMEKRGKKPKRSDASTDVLVQSGVAKSATESQEVEADILFARAASKDPEKAGQDWIVASQNSKMGLAAMVRGTSGISASLSGEDEGRPERSTSMIMSSGKKKEEEEMSLSAFLGGMRGVDEAEDEPVRAAPQRMSVRFQEESNVLFRNNSGTSTGSSPSGSRGLAIVPEGPEIPERQGSGSSSSDNIAPVGAGAPAPPGKTELRQTRSLSPNAFRRLDEEEENVSRSLSHRQLTGGDHDMEIKPRHSFRRAATMTTSFNAVQARPVLDRDADIDELGNLHAPRRGEGHKIHLPDGLVALKKGEDGEDIAEVGERLLREKIRMELSGRQGGDFGGGFFMLLDLWVEIIHNFCELISGIGPAIGNNRGRSSVLVFGYTLMWYRRSSSGRGTSRDFNRTSSRRPPRIGKLVVQREEGRPWWSLAPEPFSNRTISPPCESRAALPSSIASRDSTNRGPPGSTASTTLSAKFANRCRPLIFFQNDRPFVPAPTRTPPEIGWWIIVKIMMIPYPQSGFFLAYRR